MSRSRRRTLWSSTPAEYIRRPGGRRRGRSVRAARASTRHPIAPRRRRLLVERRDAARRFCRAVAKVCATLNCSQPHHPKGSRSADRARGAAGDRSPARRSRTTTSSTDDEDELHADPSLRRRAASAPQLEVSVGWPAPTRGCTVCVCGAVVDRRWHSKLRTSERVIEVLVGGLEAWQGGERHAGVGRPSSFERRIFAGFWHFFFLSSSRHGAARPAIRSPPPPPRARRRRWMAVDVPWFVGLARAAPRRRRLLRSFLTHHPMQRSGIVCALLQVAESTASATHCMGCACESSRGRAPQRRLVVHRAPSRRRRCAPPRARRPTRRQRARRGTRPPPRARRCTRGELGDVAYMPPRRTRGLGALKATHPRPPPIRPLRPRPHPRSPPPGSSTSSSSSS